MPTTYAIQLAAMGKFLPERIVANAELEAELGLADGWIERATGVRERRRAASGTSTAAMAAAAIRQALERAGRRLDELDLIVGASSGPEQLIPCTAALVQKELGAPEGKSVCFDLSATCLSFVVALHTLAPLIAAGHYRCVALFSSEMTAHSLNPTEPESAALLGDAAVAAIVTATPLGQKSCLQDARFATYATSGADLTRFLGGGSRRHPNDPATTPLMNTFEMHGRHVLRLVMQHFPSFVSGFLTDNATALTAIDRVVPHQASGIGIRGLAGLIGVTPEQLCINLPERGNCIAASLPLALCEAWEQGAVARDQKVLLLGTGAGLTMGAALLTL